MVDYGVHDLTLTEQQSLSLKGQWAIKPAETAQPPSILPWHYSHSYFPNTSGNYHPEAMKKHFRPFLHLSNHFISDTKMSLCCYMDPQGVMKFDSAAE